MTDSPMAPEVDLTMVTMVFDSREANEAAADRLLSVLSKYVVVSRGHPGCRNMDLCASATRLGRYLIVQKWESPDAQAAHFDSAEMVDMAKSCEGLLEKRPDIDLFVGISAHDLN
ncbi:MAG: putative quinol monooxygenase [Acidimicrobiales bacterium]